MQDSADQVAELEQLKEKFKLSASQNLDKLFTVFLEHLQKSKHCEEKATQVSPDDFETTFANSTHRTDFLIPENSPLNLVIDESTDSEQAPVQQQNQNFTRTVTQTKSKRSFENGNSDPNGILVGIKEEIYDEHDITFPNLMFKKQKTTSDSANNSTKDGQSSALNNAGNVEKNLKTPRKSNKNKLENEAKKATQQMSKVVNSSSDSDSTVEQNEEHDQEKTKASSSSSADSPSSYAQSKQALKDYKIQLLSKTNYALQPTHVDKHHKFSISNLKCPVENCKVILNTQPEMNHHMNMPHSTPLYTCPIMYCTSQFKNSNDLIAHGNMNHPHAQVWYCTKPFCNEVLDSAEALITHNYIAHHLGTFLCLKCNFKGSSRQTMLKHYDSEHSLNSTVRYRTDFTKCVYNCNTYLTSREQFDMHLLNEHNKFPFMCLAYHCNSSFKTNAELNSHLALAHRRIINWKCPYNNCNSPPFEDAKKLYIHMYTSHYQGRFSCMVSGCKFFSNVRAGILRHCEQEHNIF